jgi:regulatory protein
MLMVWSRTKRSSHSRKPSGRDERWAADEAVGGRITAIEGQRRAESERVNVHLDGAFAFSLAIELAAGLHEGDELDISTIRGLLSRDHGQRAYDQALHFLAPRPRSVAEIRQRLQKHGHEPTVVDPTLQRLADRHFVDDDEVASYWVGQRQAHRPRGPRALRSELRGKGVDTGVVDRAIETALVDQESDAYRAGERKARALSSADEHAFRQTLSTYLVRRGFDYDAVRATVGRLWAETKEHL